ncbi:magnesium transporter [Hypericibacter adhaerens]|uniref:Magnesium transport protein CorA n=2 Tax=Hypericibacter adhaerens TaxID=2602016 RepID=A0A5J6MUJ1_9PROT|nr:magnesium transporter [Hypericibacter adhaerens]
MLLMYGTPTTAVTQQVVNCRLYCEGRAVKDIDIEHLDEVADAPGQLIWIGLYDPDEEVLAKVQKRFGLHELAIEDAHLAHQRPKLEVYGDTLFLVLHTARRQAGEFAFGESHFFIGRGYVVTIRHGPSETFAAVRQRCEAAPQMLRKGEDFILYALMDFVVDNYFPIIDAMEAEIEQIEDDIFSNRFTSDDIEKVFGLRRDLVALRHAVQPLQDICTRIMRFDVPLIDRDTYPYFRDVQDHAIKASQGIETLRETVGSALDAHLMLSSVKANEVMKKLAGWAAILAVPTAIAGIYGMNFKYMPELEWAWGYPLTLVAIGGICGYLYYRFHKAGWI